MSRHSAISGPVNRNRRSAAIACDPLLAGAMRDPMRRRGTITQPELALGAVAAHPLAGAADTDSGGLGRLATVRSRSTTAGRAPDGLSD